MSTLVYEQYLAMDPLAVALGASAFFGLACWLLSIIFREYSWVDRLWSIVPVLYTAHFAAHAHFSDLRLNIMTALTVVWGVRLTYNYARKGGYKPGGEDYRWVEVKNAIGPIGFQLLNATFIAPLQNLLLLAITLPAYVAFQHVGEPLTGLDYLAAALFTLFFLGETIADEQQWRFQTEKYAAKAKGQPVEQEFLTTGLFRFSRHPNFFCEQAMWWSFYLFTVAVTGQWLHWTIAGVASLTLLFQASTWLTERISVRKYPSYQQYQRTTSRLLPWFPRMQSE